MARKASKAYSSEAELAPIVDHIEAARLYAIQADRPDLAAMLNLILCSARASGLPTVASAVQLGTPHQAGSEPEAFRRAIP